MPSLEVQIGSLRLKTPVIAAAGTFGFGQEYREFFDVSVLGAICAKTVTLRARTGNPPPRLWETPCGLLNSIGLENPGIETFLKEELPKMRKLGTVIVASIWGEEADDYGALAAAVDKADVEAIELNVSCPNVPGKGFVGAQAGFAAGVVRSARAATTKPLWVKLAPEGEVLAAALAAQEAGAQALCIANTFRAMAIDISTGRPVFANVLAGLSGPAINPLALRWVYELFPRVEVPLIASGGITTWQDTIEFIMAGAHAVQVGTGNFVDPLCTLTMVEGLKKFAEERNLEGWEVIRGCAHRR